MDLRIFFLLFKFIIMPILKCQITTNSQEEKETLRFVFSVINTGDTSPSYLDSNNNDILNEKWDENTSELTAIGARKQYILGFRNRKKYEGFISKEYLFNEIFASTMNSTSAAESVFCHLHGMFPAGTGLTLTAGQIEKALPKTPIEDLEKLKTDLGNNALLNKVNSFRIFTHQDLDRDVGLQKIHLCAGVKPYIDDSIDNYEVLNTFGLFKQKYEDIILSLDLVKPEGKNPAKLNLTHAVLIAETFIKDYNDSRELKIFDKI